MLTVPIEVAKMVMVKKAHPVEAWRMYFSLSLKDLSDRLPGIGEKKIAQIESSNQHLKPAMLEKLASAFGLHQEALNIRFFSSNIIQKR